MRPPTPEPEPAPGPPEPQPEENSQVNAAGWPGGKILVGIGIILLCGGIGIWIILAIMAYRAPSDAWKFAWKVVSLLVLFGSGALSLHLKKSGYVDRFLKEIRDIGPEGASVIVAIGLGLSLPIGGIIFAECSTSSQEQKRVVPPDFVSDAAPHKHPEDKPRIATQPDAQATIFPDAANEGRQCRLEIEPSCDWMRTSRASPGGTPWDHKVLWLCASATTAGKDILELVAGWKNVLEATDELALRTVPDESSECESGSIIRRLHNDKTSKQTWPFSPTETPTYYCLTALINDGSKWPSTYEEYMQRRSASQDSSDGSDAATKNGDDEPDASNKPAVFYSNTLRIRKVCE